MFLFNFNSSLARWNTDVDVLAVLQSLFNYCGSKMGERITATQIYFKVKWLYFMYIDLYIYLYIYILYIFIYYCHNYYSVA